jgi:hypothetical protein
MIKPVTGLVRAIRGEMSNGTETYAKAEMLARSALQTHILSVRVSRLTACGV